MKRIFFIAAIVFTGFFASGNDGPTRIWILFKDRPSQILKFRSHAFRDFSAAAIRRRQLRADIQWDEADLPVASQYVSQLQQGGAVVYRESRWLNGVSAFCDSSCRSRISQLPFVSEIRPVIVFHRPREPQLESFGIPSPDLSARKKLQYGLSLSQLEQINVPPAHKKGFAGQGEIVAIFDSGFRKDHIAFKNHVIVAEHDFVFNDNNVNDGATTDDHGTGTWSCVGGEAPGKLYGPAFRAPVILAVTEDVRTESAMEEDNWIAALEWADRNGASVVSSSLGYPTLHNPSDLNGVTPLISRAASTAARKGLLVANAAGNEGPAPATLGAPADAKKILTVGSVDSSGTISTFSSRGPTADGRIKPEVVARGSATFVAWSSSDSTFLYKNGTSFATPLVAGSAAVILSAHPDWKPVQVREALMQTASQSDHPDNDYGWGIINVAAALEYLPKKSIVIEHTPLKDTSNSSRSYHLIARIRAQRGVDTNAIFLFWKTETSGVFEKILLTAIADQPDKYEAFIPAQPHGTTIDYYFSAKDQKGKTEKLPLGAAKETFDFAIR